jgi:hypothetical protein
MNEKNKTNYNCEVRVMSKSLVKKMINIHIIIYLSFV